MKLRRLHNPERISAAAVEVELSTDDKYTAIAFYDFKEHCLAGYLITIRELESILDNDPKVIREFFHLLLRKEMHTSRLMQKAIDEKTADGTTLYNGNDDNNDDDTVMTDQDIADLMTYIAKKKKKDESNQ